MGNLEPLEEAVEPIRDAGLQVELGGEVPGTAAAPMEGYGELIGVGRRPADPGARVRLRRRRRAARSPSPSPASASAAAASCCSPPPWTSAPPRRWSPRMVGLGVGIDYALLIATRHAEYLQAGHPVADAAGPGRRHRRPVGRLRGRHRPGLADGPAPVRPPGLRLVRLRHRDRRRRRDGRRAHAGARRCAGSPAAGCCRARSRKPRRRRTPASPRAAHRPLGGPGRPHARCRGRSAPRW